MARLCFEHRCQDQNFKCSLSTQWRFCVHQLQPRIILKRPAPTNQNDEISITTNEKETNQQTKPFSTKKPRRERSKSNRHLCRCSWWVLPCTHTFALLTRNIQCFFSFIDSIFLQLKRHDAVLTLKTISFNRFRQKWRLLTKKKMHSWKIYASFR